MIFLATWKNSGARKRTWNYMESCVVRAGDAALALTMVSSEHQPEEGWGVEPIDPDVKDDDGILHSSWIGDHG